VTNLEVAGATSTAVAAPSATLTTAAVEELAVKVQVTLTLLKVASDPLVNKAVAAVGAASGVVTVSRTPSAALASYCCLVPSSLVK